MDGKYYVTKSFIIFCLLCTIYYSDDQMRVRWAEHVEQMSEFLNVRRIVVEESEGRRVLFEKLIVPEPIKKFAANPKVH
jgi:hypothetical protein